MPALLVGVALLLTGAGNRWGAYILSPIPGIFLADLLLLMGALGGVLLTSLLRPVRWVVVTYGIVWAYVVIVLLPEFLTIPHGDRYWAVRDDAPFLYLALVPGIAMALTVVAARRAIIVMRVVTALAAVGPVISHIFGVERIQSTLLGSGLVGFLDYRADLTGAVIAIGIVAWSGWPQFGLRPMLAVQMALVGSSGIVASSRSGLMAVVVGIGVLMWMQHRPLRGMLVGVLAALVLVIGLIWGPNLSLGSLAGSAMSSPTAPSAAPDSEPVGAGDQPAAPMEPEIPLIAMAQRTGTVAARIDTWRDVITGLSTDGTWFTGGSAGSDYLYELCTGLSEAPLVLLTEKDGPKCSVDDYGPEPVVRDPHNWILNISVTHGVLGVLVFILALVVTWWRGRGSEIFRLSSWTIGFFLISGMTFLISAGYALVPIAIAAGWIVSRAGVTPRQQDVGSSVGYPA